MAAIAAAGILGSVAVQIGLGAGQTGADRQQLHGLEKRMDTVEESVADHGARIAEREGVCNAVLRGAIHLIPDKDNRL
jgi:hypothetical protein